MREIKSGGETLIDGVKPYHGKEPNEIREELKYALRHWGQYGMVRHKDENNTSKPQLGPRMPLNAEAQKQVYYEAMWHNQSKNLAPHLRMSLELYYVKNMDRSAVAEELEYVPPVVSNNCCEGLNQMADIIWRLQNEGRCKHCGAHSVVIQQTPASAWKPERDCLLCARKQ